jgi:anti-sigma-K factor RskA
VERNAVHELNAAYALDALDDHEASAYEEHLATCERCRNEVAGLQEAAAALAYAVTQPPPSSALRGRILEHARAERRESGTLVPLRRRWVVPALGAAAAVAACAAIGLGVWAATLAGSLDDTRAEVGAQRSVLAVLADPRAARIAVQGADGALVVARDGRAALVLRRLRPAPSGKTYEAWVIAGGSPRPAGVFQGWGGNAALVLSHRVARGTTVAVTVEKAGGVAVPTQKPRITARA